MRLRMNKATAAAGAMPAARPDGTGKTYTVSGLDPGSTATLFADGAQAASATVDGSGKATWTLPAIPAAGVRMTFKGSFQGDAGVSAGPPPPTLGALVASPSGGTVGTAYAGTISGVTAGATVTLGGSGAPGLSVTGTGAERTLSGTPTAAGDVDLFEALPGAANTPNRTAAALTIAAAPPAPANAVLREDGSNLLREDGAIFIREDA